VSGEQKQIAVFAAIQYTYIYIYITNHYKID
jgi:hypothetical protein